MGLMDTFIRLGDAAVAARAKQHAARVGLSLGTMTGMALVEYLDAHGALPADLPPPVTRIDTPEAARRKASRRRPRPRPPAPTAPRAEAPVVPLAAPAGESRVTPAPPAAVCGRCRHLARFHTLGEQGRCNQAGCACPRLAAASPVID